MKLEDKLMNRIIEGKSDLEEVVSKNGTNLEIGGNLEVDGKLKVNSGLDSGIKIVFYREDNLDSEYIILNLIGMYNRTVGYITSYIGIDDSEYCGFVIITGNLNQIGSTITYYQFGDDVYIYVTKANYDTTNNKYIIFYESQLNIDEVSFLTTENQLYRHDIVGKISDTESVSFTWLVSQAHSNNYNTPIDSLTDLVNLVLVGKYTASGVINGKQVIQVIKSSNTTSGLKCLCVDGSEVTFNPTTVTDDVEILQ